MARPGAGIEAACFKQIRGRPRFHDPAAGHHANDVRALSHRQSVGDKKHRPAECRFVGEGQALDEVRGPRSARGLLDRLEIRVQTSETDVRRGTFLVLYRDLKKNGCPLPDFGFGKFTDVMAIPKNPTLTRFMQPGDEFDERAFPGAFSPNAWRGSPPCNEGG